MKKNNKTKKKQVSTQAFSHRYSRFIFADRARKNDKNKLNWNEVSILAYLQEIMNLKDKTVKICVITTLAKRTNLRADQVVYSIRKLKRLGHIEAARIKSGKGYLCAYSQIKILKPIVPEWHIEQLDFNEVWFEAKQRLSKRKKRGVAIADSDIILEVRRIFLFQKKQAGQKKPMVPVPFFNKKINILYSNTPLEPKKSSGLNLIKNFLGPGPRFNFLGNRNPKNQKPTQCYTYQSSKPIYAFSKPVSSDISKSIKSNKPVVFDSRLLELTTEWNKSRENYGGKGSMPLTSVDGFNSDSLNRILGKYSMPFIKYVILYQVDVGCKMYNSPYKTLQSVLSGNFEKVVEWTVKNELAIKYQNPKMFAEFLKCAEKLKTLFGFPVYMWENMAFSEVHRPKSVNDETLTAEEISDYLKYFLREKRQDMEVKNPFAAKVEKATDEKKASNDAVSACLGSLLSFLDGKT